MADLPVSDPVTPAEEAWERWRDALPVWDGIGTPRFDDPENKHRAVQANRFPTGEAFLAGWQAAEERLRSHLLAHRPAVDSAGQAVICECGWSTPWPAPDDGSAWPNYIDHLLAARSEEAEKP